MRAGTVLLLLLIAVYCLLICSVGQQNSFSLAAKDKQSSSSDKTAASSKRAQATSSSRKAKSSESSKRRAARDQDDDDDDDDDEDDDDDDDHDDGDHDDQNDQNESPNSGKASKRPKQDSKLLADWLHDQQKAGQDVIELVSADMLELLIDNLENLVVLYYDPSQCSEPAGAKKARGSAESNKCKKILQELENIDDDTDKVGIQFVKCDNVEHAKSLGISSLPALVYYEKSASVPSIYVGDLEQEDEVLAWLIKQKNEDTIEEINRELLGKLISGQSSSAGNKGPSSHVYLAVLFYKQQQAESERALEQLESIDDDLSEFNIHLVKLADDLMAKKYGVKPAPGLVLFRHGEPLKYPGSLLEPDNLLRWLTKPENLETKNSIESVNEKMFHRFVKETKHLAILFYSEQPSQCKQCQKVLEVLETIDDDLDELGIRFIKIESPKLARNYGVHALPSLVFISQPPVGEKKPTGGAASDTQATIYAGSLRKADDILGWLREQKSPDLHQIPELSGKACRDIVKSEDHVAIYLYSDEPPVAKKGHDEDDDDDDDGKKPAKRAAKRKAQDDTEDIDDDEDDDNDDDDDEDQNEADDDIIAGLENIDSECRRQQIEFVKTKDKSFIKEFGLARHDLPALIYFEQGQPSIYEGELEAEEDLLDWLVRQRSEDTIEEVNRRLLENLIETSPYLVVLFYKSTHCKSCQAVLETLERIDDDCDQYGIHMVKINDLPLAKRYGLKTFPGLVYFRNGNPLVYSGDLKDDEQVLEWLLADDQRELNDEIEDINGRMLDKLIDTSPFLAALFYDDDCTTMCTKVLHELEKIDDDTDLYGIDFVKINDFQAARKYNVHNFPTLVYFRKQTPSYYDGDLLDEGRVLNWLTSNDVFELDDEIEEVNKKMLDKLLETSDYIAVYFYEKNCQLCEDVLKELEHIDDEADSLDIMFVKIRDMNYARKFGITQAPSLVYFRKKFPSIYRGDLMKEDKVLEWLRKNRYRNPELNLFMYALFTITISFIVYTIFLVFCVKKKQD